MPTLSLTCSRSVCSCHHGQERQEITGYLPVCMWTLNLSLVTGRRPSSCGDKRRGIAIARAPDCSTTPLRPCFFDSKDSLIALCGNTSDQGRYSCETAGKPPPPPPPLPTQVQVMRSVELEMRGGGRLFSPEREGGGQREAFSIDR
jgi:hypothetical protein